MTDFASRSGLAGAARITLMGSLLLFTVTIVIGILNGIDVWEPDHDTLITHVHVGTLGWITLGVSSIALLMFSRDREVSSDELVKATTMAWSMVGAITLYVAAFLAGDNIFDDRIQRPFAGTLLFIVVIWFFVWLVGANRAYGSSSPSRLGLMLSWVSLMVGAVFGIILGLFIANGEVPGLSDEVAARVADAHPPAMLIGYLLLAAFATIEWLLHSDKSSARPATIQMWLLFVAGIVINFAFVSGKDEELAGPANLLMIVAVFMLLWRSREELKPSGWRGAGAGAFPRIASLALVVALVLLTILISWTHCRRDRFRCPHRIPGRPDPGLRPLNVHRGDDQRAVRRSRGDHRVGQDSPSKPGTSMGCQYRIRRLCHRPHHDDSGAQANLYPDHGCRPPVRDCGLFHGVEIGVDQRPTNGTSSGVRVCDHGTSRESLVLSRYDPRSNRTTIPHARPPITAVISWGERNTIGESCVVWLGRLRWVGSQKPRLWRCGSVGRRVS